MPTCLLHFCAEWRRARRVIQLQLLSGETKIELAQVIQGDGEVCCDGPLATAYGIGFWKADATEAVGVRKWLIQDAPTNELSTTSTCDDGNPCIDLLEESSTISAVKRPSRPASPSSAAMSARRRMSSPEVSMKDFPRRGQLRSANTSFLPSIEFSSVEERPENSTRRRGSYTSGSIQTKTMTTSNFTKLMNSGPKRNAAPTSLLFRNPSHPLSQFREVCNKETFVHELRKTWVSERLFMDSGSTHVDGLTLSSADAEDLFEVLMILQSTLGLNYSTTILQTGRIMDEAVDRVYTLTRFRQMIEKDSSSVLTFMKIFDGKKIMEADELRHSMHFNTVTADVGVVVSGNKEISLSEQVWTILDPEVSGKIHRDDLQKLFALVAVPRPSMSELIGQLELRNGFGRCGFESARPQASCQTLFDHFCTTEQLGVSPEDVAHFVRAAMSTAKSSSIAGVLTSDQVSNFLKQPPLEATWAFEPHACDSLYSALGIRALLVERNRRQDAGLPPEAFILEDEDVPSQDYLQTSFNRIWERYGSSLISSCSSTSERQLKDGCFQRFEEVARSVIENRRSATSGMISVRKGQPTIRPRSLFPNIGDVLCTPSGRLLAGQTCVVRYRLQGPTSFWPASHIVMKDEKDAVAWPVSRRVLGDTPFIALVPRGLRYVGASGGGFYLGSQAFTSFDPNLRADLPKDASGQTALFGLVEIAMPSLARAARKEGGKSGTVQEYELRLFCAQKQRIIGCVGEPVPIRVIQQVVPPPIESLQLRCEGTCVALRWSFLDFEAPASRADCIRLCMRIAHTTIEKHFTLDPDISEYDFEDLAPDTEYEFRIRLENNAGAGRDVSAVCRTNALCPPTQSLVCEKSSTAHVELRWAKPKTLGNEATKDAYQAQPEAIRYYEATLRVHDEKDDSPASTAHDETDTNCGDISSSTRSYRWTPDMFKDDKAGFITANLSGLRPDTRYALEGFCAINSMGPGPVARPLFFWTMPLPPRINTVRVKGQNVLIELSEVGGLNVVEYSITVHMTGQPEDKAATFSVPISSVIMPKEWLPGVYPELPLPFSAMPKVEGPTTHFIRIRASNAGGESEWSYTFKTGSISRQQGVDVAQAALKRVIENPTIDALAKVLEDCKGIEFQDYSNLEQATAMLQSMRAVKSKLLEAMKVRYPKQLAIALEASREVRLPGLGKPEALLKKLEQVVQRLDTAKGISPLKLAIRAGQEAKLPQKILQVAMERLKQREAAQKDLERAMEAARVPGLQKALGKAEDMDLPAEAEGRRLLALFVEAETALNKAVTSGLISDLHDALELVQKCGLREDGLIASANKKLKKLTHQREDVQEELKRVMETRHPIKLHQAIEMARLAQVSEELIAKAESVQKRSEEHLKRVEDASGIPERKVTLQAAKKAKVPKELLETGELQLQKLIEMNEAKDKGDPEQLRTCLRQAILAGAKVEELLEARVIYRDWGAAIQSIEAAIACGRSKPLQKALIVAQKVGINQATLQIGMATLLTFQSQDRAKQSLKDVIDERHLEDLLKAWKVASDEAIMDLPLLNEAKDLIIRLARLRREIQLAVEAPELRNLHKALEAAKTHPALPDEETVFAEQLLRQLQNQELEAIMKGLSYAAEDRNFKVALSLLNRARTAMQAEVEVQEETFPFTEEWIETVLEEQKFQLEFDLARERALKEVPVFPDKIPKPHSSKILPNCCVFGELDLAYQASGELQYVLPREIVEATVVANRFIDEGTEVSPDDATGGDLNDLFQEVDGVMEAIGKLLAPADEVKPLDECNWISGDVGRRHRRCSMGWVAGRLERRIAAYIRAEHKASYVAEALSIHNRLGDDFWLPGARVVELEEQTPTEVAEELSKTLSEGIFRNIICKRTDTSQVVHRSRPRQLADCVRHVHARVLRTLNIDLHWSYPKGIFDSLSSSCLLFSKEKLIDIIDHRGAQGYRFGAGFADLERVHLHMTEDRSHNAPNPRSKTTKRGSLDKEEYANFAVAWTGDTVDTELREGKQTMQVRLDLLPNDVTDLIFVLTPSSSRDLSRFASLRTAVWDADAQPTELLCGFEFENSADAEDEAAIMAALYKREDGLWRVNSLDVLCKGSHRDYRPIIAQLLKMGWPRDVGMRNMVPTVLEMFTDRFELTDPSKAAKVEIKENGALDLTYAMELDGESEMKWPRIIDDMTETEFHNGLLEALHSADSGERFASEDFRLHPSVFRSLKQLTFELSWKFPDSTEVTSPEDCCELDASSFMFEGQGLREVLDYRGPHGVRLVNNGVLDYRGHWVGKIGVGDASGGALAFVSSEIDRCKRQGKAVMKVDFGLVPQRVTDIFFLLSSATERPATSFGDVSFAVYDSNDMNHQVFASEPKSTSRKEEASAILMCRCTRLDQRHWSLDVFQEPCNGNVIDYRPMLLSLRALQKMNYDDMPLPWPHRLMQTEEEKKKAPILPRLPPTIERRLSNMGRRQSTSSVRKLSSLHSGAGYSPRRPSIGVFMGHTLSTRRQMSPSPGPRLTSNQSNSNRASPVPNEVETGGLQRLVSEGSEADVEFTARGRRKHRTSHVSMGSDESVNA